MSLTERIIAAALDHAGNLAHDIRDALRAGDNPTTTPDPAPDGPETDPVDSPSYTNHTWRTTFASDIKTGDLIAVDGRHYGGPHGKRALRVTGRRDGEHQAHPFAAPHPAITFLFVDLDTEEADHLTALPDSPLIVAVEVPDSVPTDLGKQK